MSDLKKKQKLQTKEQQVDETPSILLAFINAGEPSDLWWHRIRCVLSVMQWKYFLEESAMNFYLKWCWSNDNWWSDVGLCISKHQMILFQLSFVIAY